MCRFLDSDRPTLVQNPRGDSPKKIYCPGGGVSASWSGRGSRTCATSATAHPLRAGGACLDRLGRARRPSALFHATPRPALFLRCDRTTPYEYPASPERQNLSVGDWRKVRSEQLAPLRRLGARTYRQPRSAASVQSGAPNNKRRSAGELPGAVESSVTPS